MNIESTASATITKTSDTSSSSSSTNTVNQNGTSFKDELKTQEKSSTDAQAQKASDDAAKTDNAENAQNSDKNQTASQTSATNNAAQQANKNQLTAEDKTELETKEMFDPLSALSAKIESINNLRGNSNSNSKTQSIGTKSEDISKDSLFASIKMDNNDAAFFINMVQNQNAQVSQSVGVNVNNGNNFVDIKTEATQKTVQVSSTLMDALNQSMQTGKSFRVDFGGDVAVIMKVDKEGVISANFIPGSAAVENYLRNNIEGLRQSFSQQNLSYNELSYSQQQNKKQQNNNKEKENE